MKAALEFEDRYIDAAMECEMLRGRLGAMEIALQLMFEQIPDEAAAPTIDRFFEGFCANNLHVVTSASPRRSPGKITKANLGKIKSPVVKQISSSDSTVKLRQMNQSLTTTVASQNEVLEQLFEENKVMLSSLRKAQVSFPVKPPKGRAAPTTGGRKGKFESEASIIKSLEDRVNALENGTEKQLHQKQRKKKKKKKRKKAKTNQNKKAIQKPSAKISKEKRKPPSEDRVKEIPAESSAKHKDGAAEGIMSCVHAVNGTRLNIRVTKSATPAGLLFTARDREGGKEEYTVFAGWHYAHYLTRNTPELSSKERVTELSAALLKCLKFELVGGKRSLVLKELESKEPEKSKTPGAAAGQREKDNEKKQEQDDAVTGIQKRRRAIRERMRRGSITMDEADQMETEIDAELLEKFMTRRSSTRRKSSIFNPENENSVDKQATLNASGNQSEGEMQHQNQVPASPSPTSKKNAAFLFKITRQDTFGAGAGNMPMKSKSKGLAHSLLRGKAGGKVPASLQRAVTVPASASSSLRPAATAETSAPLVSRSDTVGNIARLVRPALPASTTLANESDRERGRESGLKAHMHEWQKGEAAASKNYVKNAARRKKVHDRIEAEADKLKAAREAAKEQK